MGPRIARRPDRIAATLWFVFSNGVGSRLNRIAYPGAVRRGSSRPDWCREAGTDIRRNTQQPTVAAVPSIAAAVVNNVVAKAAHLRYYLMICGGYRVRGALAELLLEVVFRFARDELSLLSGFVAARSIDYVVRTWVLFHVVGGTPPGDCRCLLWLNATGPTPSVIAAACRRACRQF